MNTKIFLVIMVLSTSVFSYASSYNNAVTSDFVFDESSIVFSKDCKNSGAAIHNSRIDIFYNSLRVEGRGSKTCSFEIDIEASSGWYVEIKSSASITGFYNGRGFLALVHAQAGTNPIPIPEYFEGVGTYIIEQPNDVITKTGCGTKARLKTQVSLASHGGSSTYLDATLGFIKYSFSWHQC